MLDFIGMGFAELWETGSKRKNRNENEYILSAIGTLKLSYRKLEP